jgi:predicted nucleic acid-binding protein
LSFDLDRLLRALRPEKQTIKSAARDAVQLRAVGTSTAKRPVTLDTTAYIHAGQGKLPNHIVDMVAQWPLYHCSAALGEVAHGIGRLDPNHPDTPKNKAFLETLLRRIPQHRVITPSDDIHIAAGILTGIIARLEKLGSGGHRSRINDVLIFLAAQKAGAAVITANVSDFDTLQQLLPNSNVIFY